MAPPDGPQSKAARVVPGEETITESCPAQSKVSKEYVAAQAGDKTVGPERRVTVRRQSDCAVWLRFWGDRARRSGTKVAFLAGACRPSARPRQPPPQADAGPGSCRTGKSAS